MFKQINGCNYVIDKPTADDVYNSVKRVVSVDNIAIDIAGGLIEGTIKELISFKIALLVYTNMYLDLVKHGFITVKFSSDIGFEITVAIIDEKLAYGVLVK